MGSRGLHIAGLSLISTKKSGMTANLRAAGHWCKVAGPLSSADWVCCIGLDPKPNCHYLQKSSCGRSQITTPGLVDY